MNRQRFVATMILLLSLTGRAALAAIQFGAPFGDHMVLQQGVPVTIWGSGCPGGDTVRLAIAGQSVMTTSDWQGKWSVQLAPMKAGGPYQLLVEVGGYGPIVPSPAANARGGAEVNDVLVGEVVHAPAPSDAAVSSVDMPASSGEQADAAHPYAWIRIFSTLPGRADPQWSTVPSGTSVADRAGALNFARALYNRLHVPIGVVEAPGVLPGAAVPASGSGPRN